VPLGVRRGLARAPPMCVVAELLDGGLNVPLGTGSSNALSSSLSQSGFQQASSSGLYRERSPAAHPDDLVHRVLERLYIGSGRAAWSLDKLTKAGVTHIVNAAPQVESCAHTNALKYLSVDVLDSPEAPIEEHFERVNSFVRAAWEEGGRVLVHCHGGVSRAAALVMAFLMGSHGMCYVDAWEHLKSVRRVVAPNPGFIMQLKRYEREILLERARESGVEGESLATLPEEAIFRVFSFLGSKNRARQAAVNRRFRALIRQPGAWTRLTLDGAELAEHGVKAGAYLRKLACRSCIYGQDAASAGLAELEVECISEGRVGSDTWTGLTDLDVAVLELLCGAPRLRRLVLTGDVTVVMLKALAEQAASRETVVEVDFRYCATARCDAAEATSAILEALGTSQCNGEYTNGIRRGIAFRQLAFRDEPSHGEASMPPELVGALATGLRTGRVRSLTLHGCHVGEAGAVALVEALAATQEPAHLELSKCGISPALAGGLTQHCRASVPSRLAIVC